MSMKNMTIGQIQELVENPGMPIRQPATALMTIDTANRTAGTKVNNLYINKQQTLMNGYFTRVALTELNMDWDIPNVNPYNNTFKMVFYYGTGVFKAVQFEVTEGFYDMQQLASELETLIQTYINTDVDLTGLYTIDITANQVVREFTITNTNVSNKLFGIVPIFSVRSDASDLCEIMGLSTVDPTLQFKTIVGSYATMLYTPYFDIVSQQLTKKQNVADNSTSVNTGKNLLARIYLNQLGILPNKAIEDPNYPEEILGVSPFTIHLEFNQPKQIYWDTKEFINVVDLTLYDNKGRVLYERPSSFNPDDNTEYLVGTGETNWQLTFQITET
jgi:hypothetical protein